MKKVRQAILSSLLLVFCASLTICEARPINESLIVSTAWVAQHLKDDSLVLLEVGEKDDFKAAHIPGAQFITLTDLSTQRGKGLALELPSLDQLTTAFEKLGVSNQSRIVVYFSKDGLTPTARVFMTLDYLGLGERTSIMDGGLPAWRAENRPVTAEIVPAKPGKLVPVVNRSLVVDAAWVNANLNNASVKIIDARAPQYYSGADPGRMPRGGHIPNARNIPFSSVVDEANRFKSASALAELFKAADVKPGNTIATYCHIGQQASLLYFVSRYLGYETHLYDGSFEDWSNRKELPVEKSESGGTQKP